MPKGKPAPPTQVLVLEVTLLDIKPRIWRRFAIAADVTLADLHDAIQCVMGWDDAHLHEFAVKGKRYGVPDLDGGFDDDDELRDEAEYTLQKVLGCKGAKFRYTYDFGDNWEHEIKVEDIREPETGAKYPACLAGERACPPEDCGSAWGYGTLLKILKNPKHKEYKERMEWLGGSFDAETFDIEKVNKLLRR